MNKRKFYVIAGIDWSKFGIGIVFEKWPPYVVGNPNTYTCDLYFGPVFLVLSLDWATIPIGASGEKQ